MANDGAVSDDSVVSLDDAAVLIDEIRRLQVKLATYERRLEELSQLAHRDSLVDVPNRRAFIASLERLIGRVNRYGGSAAMLFVDVDGLKAINDSFGHPAGDKALLEVGALLVATVRNSDVVGRLSGDEFGILLEHADELSAWQTALRIDEEVAGAQIAVDGTSIPLSVAVGATTVYPTDTPNDVISRADRAMYRFKNVSAGRPLIAADY